MRWLEMVINFVYRMVFGIIGIYFINQVVQVVDAGWQVGLNPWTVAFTGALGMPGVVLLFLVQIIGRL